MRKKTHKMQKKARYLQFVYKYMLNVFIFREYNKITIKRDVECQADMWIKHYFGANAKEVAKQFIE